jgi:hypothetical protein
MEPRHLDYKCEKIIDQSIESLQRKGNPNNPRIVSQTINKTSLQHPFVSKISFY